MQKGKKVAVLAAASTCALAGAAAGISQSAASSPSSSSTSKSTSAAPRAHRAGAFGFGHGGPGGEVHEVEVVLNKAGTAYITVTRDNGAITAVDAEAGKITLKEGTASVTYATPTISVPSGATVLLDGVSSSLEKLKAGEHVSISSSSEGTTVFATDSSFKPSDGPGKMGMPPQGAPGGSQTPPQGAPQPPAEGY